MADLLSAAQALVTRAEEVRTRLTGERNFDVGAVGLALNRLEDGVTTAAGVLNREARFGRTTSEAYQQLEAAWQQASEVLRAGGEALATRGEVQADGTASSWLPFGLELPGSTGMLVGGVVGFGLAWWALHWLSRRGR